MRITNQSSDNPSVAHMPCLIRKMVARPYRSSAIGADALYTITTLRHTSSSVAGNKIRSLLSLRAMAYKVEFGFSRNIPRNRQYDRVERSAVISRPRAEAPEIGR